MKVGTRILFTIFLLAIMAVCVFIALTAVGVLPDSNIEGLYYGFTLTWFRYVWLAAAAVVFIISVILMFFGKPREKFEGIEVLEAAGGNVFLTNAAIIELAKRFLATKSGVVISNIVVKKSLPGAVGLTLKLAMRPGVEIPVMTQEIIEGIQEHMKMYGGIDAAPVEVRIVPLESVKN